MKWKGWIVSACATVLVAGCEILQKTEPPRPTPDFCLIYIPVYFDTVRVVDWLADNDARLLTAVVANNEKHGALCSDNG